jgi:hypothetical protein
VIEVAVPDEVARLSKLKLAEPALWTTQSPFNPLISIGRFEIDDEFDLGRLHHRATLLPATSAPPLDSPVTLPPGRSKLATSPQTGD